MEVIRGRVFGGRRLLVKEGLIWRVGDGRSIDIFSDPWVADADGRFITSPRGNELSVVNDLIDEDGADWKHELIDNYFNVRDKACILAIPLTHRFPKDQLTWAYSKDGLYSTKTAYLLGKGCNLENYHQAWKDIWHMETVPKVKHFLWRACTNSLPTRELLHYRHMNSDNRCPWCEQSSESLLHSLFFCTQVRNLWTDLNCNELVPDCTVENFRDVIAKWCKQHSRKALLGSALAWFIWGRRNDRIFKREEVPLLVVKQRAQRLVEDCSKFSNTILAAAPVHRTSSPNVWLPPPASFVKVNCDACLSVAGWVSVAVVIRDSAGAVLAAGVRTRSAWPPDIAECKAILFGVQLASRFGFKQVLMESDSKVVVDKLAKEVTYFSDLDNVLNDVMYFSNSLDFVSWCHFKRDGNFVAHHLARVVPFGLEQVWENCCPPDVNPYVLMDKLSLSY